MIDVSPERSQNNVRGFWWRLLIRISLGLLFLKALTENISAFLKEKKYTNINTADYTTSIKWSNPLSNIEAGIYNNRRQASYRGIFQVGGKHITEVLANINVNPLLINKMRQIELKFKTV